MKTGFIGLGQVGARLAGNLLNQGVDLTVHDIDRNKVNEFVSRGAHAATSPAALARDVQLIITCLPSPAISASVLEGDHGVLAGLQAGKIWAEMSTTDATEVVRLAARVAERGADSADCPVSGGCHRAATGNISIFVGASRPVFDTLLPMMSILGRRVLHTGEPGSASKLKVLTNYLATANLVSLCEALVTAGALGINLSTTYEAIRISSGNSFVHETESQVILNGSRNINFTLGLVHKDIGLFQELADKAGVPLELNPLLLQIVADAIGRFGTQEWSPNLIRRLEEASGVRVQASGFPAELVDDEPPTPGQEVYPAR